jgi:hypothetical protein
VVPTGATISGQPSSTVILSGNVTVLMSTILNLGGLRAVDNAVAVFSGSQISIPSPVFFGGNSNVSFSSNVNVSLANVTRMLFSFSLFIILVRVYLTYI